MKTLQVKTIAFHRILQTNLDLKYLSKFDHCSLDNGPEKQR